MPLMLALVVLVSFITAWRFAPSINRPLDHGIIGGQRRRHRDWTSAPRASTENRELI